VDLELVRIEDEVAEAAIFGDLRVDCDSAFVCELAAELEVVEVDGVVRWLGPVVVISAHVRMIFTSVY